MSYELPDGRTVSEISVDGVVVTFDFSESDYDRAKRILSIDDLGLVSIAADEYSIVQQYIQDYQVKHHHI